MKYLFVLSGIVLGVVQFLLLRKTTTMILAGKKGYIIIITAKLLIYAASVSVLMLFFREYILYCGIGLGAAMVLSSIINFALTDKSDNKGDDAS